VSPAGGIDVIDVVFDPRGLRESFSFPDSLEVGFGGPSSAIGPFRRVRAGATLPRAE
jgi:hypothetical protein